MARKRRQCPDCSAPGYPESSIRCDYCTAIRTGQMNTLEDRINHPKLIPDFVVINAPLTGEASEVVFV